MAGRPGRNENRPRRENAEQCKWKETTASDRVTVCEHNYQLRSLDSGTRYECPCGTVWRLESGRTRRASAAEDEQTDGDGVRVENGHTDTGHGFVFRRDSDVDWRDGGTYSGATQLQLLGNNGRKVGRGSAVAGGQQHYSYENSCSPRRRAVKTERHRRQALWRRTMVRRAPRPSFCPLPSPVLCRCSVRSLARTRTFAFTQRFRGIGARTAIDRADAWWPTAYVRTPNAAHVVCVIDRAAVPTKSKNIMFL